MPRLLPSLRSLRTLPLARQSEIVVTFILLAAVAAFVWNGSELLHLVLRDRSASMQTGVQVAAAALVLNVALILFGWRRYADLQHEAELRVDGERRAALQAATDSITGLANRKGFADGVERLCRDRLSPAHCLVIVSLQMQRFKRINDRHGYDMGDALLRQIAAAMRDDVPADAVVARLSGDEFGIGGASFGRAYDYREASGDNAVAASAELRFDLAKLKPPLRRLQLYGYGDVARVWDLRRGRTESLASAGAGLRASITNNFGIGLEVGAPLDQLRRARGSITAWARF